MGGRRGFKKIFECGPNGLQKTFGWGSKWASKKALNKGAKWASKNALNGGQMGFKKSFEWGAKCASKKSLNGGQRGFKKSFEWGAKYASKKTLNGHPPHTHKHTFKSSHQFKFFLPGLHRPSG